MVVPVARIGLGQLDAVALDMIDGANVDPSAPMTLACSLMVVVSTMEHAP